MMKGFEPIVRHFDIESASELTEEDLVRMLARRIAELLDTDPDILFSTLYRLDIAENRINTVLNSPEDTARGLARLVLERQKEKQKTREEYGKRHDDRTEEIDFFDFE